MVSTHFFLPFEIWLLEHLTLRVWLVFYFEMMATARIFLNLAPSSPSGLRYSVTFSVGRLLSTVLEYHPVPLTLSCLVFIA